MFYQLQTLSRKTQKALLIGIGEILCLETEVKALLWTVYSKPNLNKKEKSKWNLVVTYIKITSS